MKLYVSIILILVLAGCQSKDPYSPSTHLSNQEQQQLLLSTVRYFGHLPKKGTHENKFDDVFDEYYSKLVADYTLEAYSPQELYEYYMVSRIAPSIKQKKVALAIRVRRDADGTIDYYEELFRTWKFEIPEMLEKSMMLFDLLIKGEDLSPYYPQNSGEEEYIEFPDDRTYFDIEQRQWRLYAVEENSEIIDLIQE
ncbi:hypothetical protein [Mongoliitalea daihaiensis]|uniref:hypothetical protein n=1 Tax=Mongoliitalea daihaiensis TaxID=2782006 RepID=UPI001F4900FC|nr:hypothetical protein [Mongoliitalea daihaiensis]UJP65686.1 hypothetical protein IPZ59_03405 [Mongoliitalea daihaiensis]